MADPEKNKYFKIERPQTSRPAASYSSEAVKRRRVDDAAAREEAARREVTRHHVRRRKGMGGGDMYLPAGLLGREIGGGGGESVAAAWSDGLVDMGRVQVGEKRGDGVNLGCFWVGSIAEDLGALYTAGESFSVLAGCCLCACLDAGCLLGVVAWLIV